MTDLDRFKELEFEKWKVYAHLRSQFTTQEEQEYQSLHEKIQNTYAIVANLMCFQYMLNNTEGRDWTNKSISESIENIINGKTYSADRMNENKLTSRVDLAYNEMKEAHKGQTRWDGITPYEVHPIKVVSILSAMGIKDEDLLIAGYMHDVLEDTNYPEPKLARLFGNKVFDLVKELTFKNTNDDDYYWTRINQMSRNALLVKYADILANISDEGKKSHHFLQKRTRALATIMKRMILPEVY